MSEKPTLVIGDVHGHLDRLEALLKQEGIIDRCECDGEHDCQICDGDGITRVNYDVEVVLLGDVGHFGHDGSPTGDFLTWRAADRWADVILWGNHDRAVVDPSHQFNGYLSPAKETEHLMLTLVHEKRLKLAHASHGFLLTHAGLHFVWERQAVDIVRKDDPYDVATWFNVNDESWFSNQVTAFDEIALKYRDAVGPVRGRGGNAGGILWRDISEKLYTWEPDHPERFRQIFGHSADYKEHQVRYVGRSTYTRKLDPRDENPSYCIDVGGKGDKPGDKTLAGIWLPDERIVQVQL